MAAIQKLRRFALFAAVALFGAAAFAPAPAEAGKISRSIGKAAGAAAVGAATRAVAKAARKNERETARDDSNDSAEVDDAAAATKPVDPATHAEQAKAKLEAENKTEVDMANSDASSELSGSAQCVAGCNPVAASPPRTVQSLRELHKSR